MHVCIAYGGVLCDARCYKGGWCTNFADIIIALTFTPHSDMNCGAID